MTDSLIALLGLVSGAVVFVLLWRRHAAGKIDDAQMGDTALGLVPAVLFAVLPFVHSHPARVAMGTAAFGLLVLGAARLVLRGPSRNARFRSAAIVLTVFVAVVVSVDWMMAQP